MSADGSIELAWADGEYRFRLPIGQLRELQDKCNAGPMEVMDRLQTRRWHVDDVRETIRLGLIGGGLKPVEALVLVKRYVDDRPLAESIPTAYAALVAALVGVPEDPVGKEEREETDPTTDGSASPSSTDQEPPSDGQPDRLTN